MFGSDHALHEPQGTDFCFSVRSCRVAAHPGSPPVRARARPLRPTVDRTLSAKEPGAIRQQNETTGCRFGGGGRGARPAIGAKQVEEQQQHLASPRTLANKFCPEVDNIFVLVVSDFQNLRVIAPPSHRRLDRNRNSDQDKPIAGSEVTVRIQIKTPPRSASGF